MSRRAKTIEDPVWVSEITDHVNLADKKTLNMTL